MSALSRRINFPLALAAAMAAAGCGKHVSKAPLIPGADAERGKLAVSGFGCGTCHVIPGVRDARGLVGPPLADAGRRVYIAGVLPNTPENMTRWLMDPPAVDAKTAMPNLGITEGVAQDIAEFLYEMGGSR